MKWYKQRLLAERHNRRQYETVIELADAAKIHTFAYEWVTEGQDLLLTEDGLSYFVSDDSLNDFWDFMTEDGNLTANRFGLPIKDGLRYTRNYLETEDGIELALMYEEGYLLTDEQDNAGFINEKRNN